MVEKLLSQIKRNVYFEDQIDDLLGNENAASYKDFKDAVLPKRPSRSKRVLTFDQIDDKDGIERTNKQIQDVSRQVEGQQLMSLKEWRDKRDIDVSAMIRLFNNLDLQVIVISGFVGVYEVHLNPVLAEDTKRQVAQQLQNRLCAKLVSLREVEERREKTNKAGNKA